MDTGNVPPGSMLFHPPRSVTPSLQTPYPGFGPGLSISPGTGHLDLKGLIPPILRGPGECAQHDNYPFEPLRRQRQPLPRDPTELTLGRTVELSSATKDLKIERFREYAAFAKGGFGSSKTALDTGRYGSDLEAEFFLQSYR